MLLLLALGAAIFLGTATQWISGMGFALVASPFVVALLGPFQGVLLVNVLGGLTALARLFTVWRRVEYRKALLLLIPAVIATVPGAIVARQVPSSVLSVTVGGLIVLTLLASFYAAEFVRTMGRGGTVLAGAVSGFMNVTAGVGGPAISAYAIATRWPQVAFAATVQLYFLVLGTASLVFKGALPSLAWPEWTACALAFALGIAAGHFLGRSVTPRAARMLVIVLAFVGAGLVIAKGTIELVVGVST